MKAWVDSIEKCTCKHLWDCLGKAKGKIRETTMLYIIFCKHESKRELQFILMFGYTTPSLISSQHGNTYNTEIDSNPQLLLIQNDKSFKTFPIEKGNSMTYLETYSQELYTGKAKTLACNSQFLPTPHPLPKNSHNACVPSGYLPRTLLNITTHCVTEPV